MNIYQELYKRSTFPSKCSEEVKKQCFDVWKDKRNQVFDAKRETLVYEKKDFTSKGKENKRPNRNILIKWKNERNKKEAPKKKPPFVVGIVRHKIYSPPFLHKSFKSTEQKKKILRQSFAPKNYKFKPPEGLQKLKINAVHPISEKGTSSPFTFNSLFINQKQVINRKELAFENVTVRPRAKPLTDSTPNKTTPKNSKIKKDVINHKCEDVKKILCTNDTDEPPIFGKLNLLKFREKTVETNEVPDEASTSAQVLSNQNINTLKPEDMSCASSYLNQQKQQESCIIKDDSAKKDYIFKPPTLYSCSQQIQSLLEQKDLRFTELYPNCENKQKTKRTSEMSSPNLSRISFMTSDTLKVDDELMTAMEKIVKERHNKGNNNSFECSGSPINDVLNVTIHANESDVVDDETLNFNLSSNHNITIPENLNSKITSIDKTVHEKDSNTNQECLLLSKIVDSPVKRISTERILTKNEYNQSKEFNAHNSLNLTPTCTELKNDLERDEKVNKNLEILFEEEHLNEEEISEKIKFSLNGSKTLESEKIETENNVLSNSNSSNEENVLISSRSFIISKKNMIPKTDTLNEQKISKHTQVTIESTAVTKEDNIVPLENIKSGSMFELEELSPRDDDISNLESEIILSKTSTENDQKPIPEKNNLNESSDNFIEHEKSATVLKNELSHTLTTDLSINRAKKKDVFDHNISNLESEITLSKTSTENDQKPIPEKNDLNEYSDNFIEHEKSATVLKNELSHTLTTDLSINEAKKRNVFNEKQPEIIDLSDSPLKQEKIDLSLSPQESMMKKPLNIENKHAESELLSSSKIFDFIHLVDSPKVEKELSESLTIENKFSYHNLEQTQKSVSDNCKSTIVLKNNKNKLRNSRTSEIETVDLISDDEEDAETLLSHIKARFAITTIASPKLYSERVALTSIENVLGSPRKSLCSQTILKENSSKTQNISIHRHSPCKTPQSPLFAKENSPAIGEASPVKNLSLYSRKVDISLTPKKTGNTPRETSLIKNSLPDINSQTSLHNSNELNESDKAASLLDNTQKPICKTPRSQKYTEENSSLVNNIPNVIISACASPQQKLLVKENSPTSSAAANQTENQTRFLSLRSRKVDVTPSPKKTRNTPRKALITKHNLPGVNGQTPKNNSEELNKNEIAVPPVEILQNSTCNTPRLVKENSPLISVVASPLKVLSLRSRKVDVSPSPKKISEKTRKTPRKVKINIPDVNIQMLKNNSDDLNENRLTASLLENVQNSSDTSRLQEQTEEKNIPIVHISPCKTPQPKLLVKENSPVTNAVSSPMRILCLRSRKVDVTPSPKKKTPKKTPRGKKTPVK